MEQAYLIPLGEDYLVADINIVDSQAVIILPGWGGTRYGPQRILLQLASKLAALGLTTLRLDFRGRGESSASANNSTLDSMIEDTCTAVQWLRAEHGIKEIILVGLCSGGNVALGAAGLLSDVKQIICWSLLPFMEDKATAKKQGTHRGGLIQQLLRKFLNPDSWRKLLRGEANVRGAVQVIAHDKEGDEVEKARKTSSRNILRDLENFPGNFKLIYGSRDPEAEGAEKFFVNWCQQHHVALTTRQIEGAPHNFYTADWTRQVIEQTAIWINES